MILATTLAPALAPALEATVLLDATQLARVVPPMIAQFFLMAAYWVGAVGEGSEAPGAAGWTRLLLPLLMITTGLLFFSEPLEAAWRPFVGGELLPAIPAGAALALALALNLAVAVVAVGVTGGVTRSPFLPLLCALPGVAWVLGSGGAWVAAAATVAALLLAVFIPEMRSEATVAPSQRRRRFLVGALVLVVVGVAGGLARAGGGPEAGGPRADGEGAASAPAGPCHLLDDAELAVECLERLLAQGRELQRAERLAAADSVFLQALEEAGALGRDEWSFAAHLARSLTRMRLEGLDSALVHVEGARALASPAHRIRLAETACVEGSLRAVAQDPRAIERLRDGLGFLGVEVRPREPFPVEDHEPLALQVIGRCLFGAGQHFARNARLTGDSAVYYLLNASDAQEAIGDAYGRAASHQWLAGVLYGQARYLDALEWYDRALELATEAGNLSAAAWATQGRSALFADLGDLPAARAGLAAAVERMEASGDRFGMAYARRLAADLALLDRRPDQAETLLDEAIEILVVLGDANAPREALPSRLGIARVRGDTAAIVEGVDALLDATDGGRILVQSAIPRLSAVGALLQVGDLERAAAVLASAGGAGSGSWIAQWTWAVRWAELEARRGNLDEAERWMREGLDWMDRLRTFVYDRDLRQAALNLRSTDLVDPDLGVATVIGRLAEGGRVATAFEMAAELRARDLEGERLRSLMLATEEVLEEEVADVRRGATLAEVAGALHTDEALLLYVTGRGGEGTTLFVVLQDRIDAHPLPPIDELEPSILRMRALVEAGEGAVELRRRLGGILLDPALGSLPPGVRRLLVVPDQGLHAVHFDALMVGAAEPQALVEHYPVTSVPSPAILVELRSQPPPRVAGGALAVSWGAPVPLADGTRLPRLRRVDLEARRVTRRLPASERISGRRATVAAVLDAAERGHPVLHVAAHAHVDPLIPGRSALFLAPTGVSSGEMRLVDIESRRLPFQLVVLSACTTAGGREDRGEGLRGPARAFLSAGSRSVVATGWAISDRAAARQMDAFYRELAAGAPVDEALARMKRAEIRAGRPPAEWAAFQLLGAPDTRIGSG